MNTTIIGIDCAVEDKNIGLALGFFDEGKGKARIEEVKVGEIKRSVVEIVTDWINSHPPALLALDAPLGWPIGLRNALQDHEAGKPILLEPDKMFRRDTDRFIKAKFHKTPLDVGADRIARTAHAALKLLREKETGQVIPLAWEAGHISRTCAIEVYPAATLKAHLGERYKEVKRYKQEDGQADREDVVKLLKKHLHLPTNLDLIQNTVDELDAVICVLACVDFLRGDVFKPKDAGVAREIAEKEGWIWVKRPV